ncbi:hypothetical protein OCF84_21660 (plasmid) [Shewanella xiamenensis]|uniref:Uncharacterized protein n=1 Tax=Shewanella xiamenensis TaxID=332186 RepID=A0ABT6UGX6_9GAMM|nr:hypothetical protein [Shewanella xiamenensis]MDI5832514.1 hypothetical protein [Shewanella xiamenensis]WHF57867.1 hypothetical protein OCF84_21660 [Shewanella xiamenensis]
MQTDINALLHFISRCRLCTTDEKMAQSELENQLIEFGAEFSREHRLSNADIVDFTFPMDGGILALEIKLKAPKRAIYRQLCRYAEHDTVKAVVLMSGTPMNLPNEILGKPTALISLGGAWL